MIDKVANTGTKISEGVKFTTESALNVQKLFHNATTLELERAKLKLAVVAEQTQKQQNLFNSYKQNDLNNLQYARSSVKAGRSIKDVNMDIQQHTRNLQTQYHLVDSNQLDSRRLSTFDLTRKGRSSTEQLVKVSSNKQEATVGVFDYPDPDSPIPDTIKLFYSGKNQGACSFEDKELGFCSLASHKEVMQRRKRMFNQTQNAKQTITVSEKSNHAQASTSKDSFASISASFVEPKSSKNHVYNQDLSMLPRSNFETLISEYDFNFQEELMAYKSYLSKVDPEMWLDLITVSEYDPSFLDCLQSLFNNYFETSSEAKFVFAVNSDQSYQVSAATPSCQPVPKTSPISFWCLACAGFGFFLGVLISQLFKKSENSKQK